ncbi:MAG: nucleotidyltransferase domain-containing protein [Clostridium sp.]|uniref:Nucleotidyltransferase domain protein n=1 Tax=Clostridium paraputrificum TaxID=29363 RepID=A0A6N3GMJ5_9CLOT|nr:nucleotidyltransferase domain-containing protein [Clostridium sp.]MBS5926933.1 nucleotidyltransferase domain-containing protein [Clostridium sp.]
MKLIEHYVQVIKDITDTFPKEVIHCYLFGSVAKKCINENSDIDLCIILNDRNDKLEEEIIKKACELKRTHDTFKLCRYCREYNEMFKDFDEGCSFIDKFYIGARCPQEDELIALDSDVERIVKFVNDVYNKVEPLVREENDGVQENLFDKIVR